MATFGAQVTQVAVVRAIDYATLQALLQTAVATQLTDHGTSQLVDAYLAGGGPGGWMATLLFSTAEAGNFPNLLNQEVRTFETIDERTMQLRIAAFITEIGSLPITFADSTPGGDGAAWMTMLWWQNTSSLDLLAREIPALSASDAEGLLAEAVTDDSRESVAVDARARAEAFEGPLSEDELENNAEALDDRERRREYARSRRQKD